MAGGSVKGHRRRRNREKNNGRQLNDVISMSMVGIRQFVIFFCMTLGILIGLLYVTALIPNTAFRANLLESAEYLEAKEDEFYRITENDRRTEIHNYADAITYNIMYSINGEGLWEELMISPFYSDNINEDYPMLKLLKERIVWEKQADTLYDRYWHGMMILLRPLFCIFSIRQIRILMMAVLFGLLALLSIQLWKRKLYTLSVAMWIAAILTGYPTIALCVEYQPVWLIMEILSLVVMKYYRRPETIAGISVISGVCCAFFDFLTTETVAIAIPLAIVLCLCEKDGLLQSFCQGIRWIFWWSASWGMAYIGTLVAKWSFSSLVLGQNRFSHALNMMTHRQGAALIYADVDCVLSEAEVLQKIAAGNTMPFSQPITALLVNVRLLLGLSGKVSLEGLLFGLLLGAGMIICVVYLFRKKGSKCILSSLLFVLGSIPVLRIMILNNHSLEHCFFVYRALFAFLVCTGTAFVYVIDWKGIKRLCTGKRIQKR